MNFAFICVKNKSKNENDMPSRVVREGDFWCVSVAVRNCGFNSK